MIANWQAKVTNRIHKIQFDQTMHSCHFFSFVAFCLIEYHDILAGHRRRQLRFIFPLDDGLSLISRHLMLCVEFDCLHETICFSEIFVFRMNLILHQISHKKLCHETAATNGGDVDKVLLFVSCIFVCADFTSIRMNENCLINNFFCFCNGSNAITHSLHT